MKHDTPCFAYSFVEKDKIRIDKAKMKKLKIKPGPELKNIKNGESIKINGKTIKAKDITYEEKGRKITFILDTVINENAVELAKNSDLLICESTYSEQEKDLASEYKHLTARQAAEIAKKSKSQRLILTHISQRYDYKEKILLQEARKVFKNTSVAEDLMKFEL
jgi:ribonuclease Z